MSTPRRWRARTICAGGRSQRAPRSFTITAISRSRTSRSTSAASILSGSRPCAASPTVSETRELRRAEFAVAAFGVTAFLLALLFVVDAVRFHHDVLIDAVEGLVLGRPDVGYLLPFGLALFDLVALGRAVRSLQRGVGAHRRLTERMPVLEERSIGGRQVRLVAGERPLAFCAGLLHPRVYLSAGAAARLPENQLATVVEHEG